MSDPLHSVAIVGVYNTRQHRDLGRTTREVLNEAALGAIADAGLTVGDVDAIVSTSGHELIFDLGLGSAEIVAGRHDLEPTSTAC